MIEKGIRELQKASIATSSSLKAYIRNPSGPMPKATPYRDCMKTAAEGYRDAG